MLSDITSDPKAFPRLLGASRAYVMNRQATEVSCAAAPG